MRKPSGNDATPNPKPPKHVPEDCRYPRDNSGGIEPKMGGRASFGDGGKITGGGSLKGSKY